MTDAELSGREALKTGDQQEIVEICLRTVARLAVGSIANLSPS
jgi:hypothetical protein